MLFPPSSELSLGGEIYLCLQRGDAQQGGAEGELQLHPSSVFPPEDR